MVSTRSAVLSSSLSFFLITLNASMVTTALPVIGRDLGDGPGLAWVLTGYSLVFAIFLLPAGVWADRVGARRAFMLGIGLFAAMSVVCALVGNLVVLLAARAVQGAAAAAVLPAGLSMLNASITDPADRARAVGRWAAAGAVALVVGSPLGGAITTAFGWPGTFWLSVPVALIALATAPHTPATAARSWGLRGLLGAPAVVVSSLTGFALNFSSYGAIFVVTLLLQQDLGQSAWTTGLVFVPMTVLIIPSNLLAGRLTARVGARRILLVGQGLMIVGLVGLAFAPAEVWQLVLWLLPIGAGAGLIAPAATTLMLNGVPAERSGLGAGLLNAARQFGSGAAPAILGALLTVSFRLSVLLAATVIALPAGLREARR
ncbi:MFS transporter [Kribbella sp. NPDC051952]|uniref:MFS transporter n=1 Tax=Kribbella sp. NPDC051952 TaxID=3154851 RepID=UPI00341ED5D1